MDDGAGPAGTMEDAFTPLTLEGVKETVENLAAKLNSAMDTETPLKDLWLAFQHWLDYVLIVCFVAYFVARMEQRRHARRLRAAKSAMSFARTRDATYTSVETGMLEWINHALRHEWRAVVGAYVDQIATQSLEETLRASETEHGRRHDRRDRRGAHLRRGPAGSEDVLLPVQPDGGLPALRV